MQKPRRNLTLFGNTFSQLEDDSINNSFSIHSVLDFEHDIDRGAISELLLNLASSRARWRSSIHRDPTRAGRYIWKEHKTLEISNHFQVVSDRSMGVECYLSRLLNKPMDPEKQPPWRVILFNQRTLICVVHHAIADGVTLFRLMLELGGATAVLPRARPKARLSLFQRLSFFIIALYNAIISPLLAPNDPQCAITKVNDSSRGTVEFRCLDDIPLAKLRQVALGGSTVNDVLFALIAGAIGRYCQQSGDTIHALMPINLRGAQEMLFEEGNKISLLNVPLELSGNFESRRDSIRAATFRLKNSIEPWLIYHWNDMMYRILPSWFIKSKALELYDHTTLMVTNVAGPTEVISILGNPIKGIKCGMAPMQTLVVALISYNGQVRINLSMDESLLDTFRLVDCFNQEIKHILATKN